MATKKFDAGDFEAFLKLLPAKWTAWPCAMWSKCAMTVSQARFVALCRKQDVAIVFAADSEFPLIADVTADFVYARIMGTRAKEKAGYPAAG